jgi:hypothetical protein
MCKRPIKLSTLRVTVVNIVVESWSLGSVERILGIRVCVKTEQQIAFNGQL